jgi:DNA replication protein DnaC
MEERTIEMTYDIYEKAKAEIARRRSEAIATSETRGEIVRAESEEIAKIDAELSKTGMLIFKTACEGGDIAPIRERNKTLQARRRELIVGLGYPADYTDIHYTCEKCSDTGYIDGVKSCSCLRELIIKGRIEASAMGKLLEKQSFDNFDLGRYSYDEKIQEKMKANLLLAKAYVRDFGKKAENLLLIGSTGTGKTHISSSIANELIHRGYDVIYDSAQNIISDFETDKFRSGYGAYESKSEKYSECDLLIIDDLGTEFTNQFTVSCLYNLLNTRQNKGLATVISTNLSYPQLQDKYEDRIFSRIVGSGCRILIFEGRDHRINNM